MNQADWKNRQVIWLIVVILLLGAFLRWAYLSSMQEMLNTDEAANGLDALSLITSPRLTLFFSSYTGRESGWHYWLTPFLLAVGIRPIALRLAATAAGILTLAASYMMNKEVFPKRAALWSMAGLAVYYFQAMALSPCHVTSFDSDECWVKTAVPAVYVLLNEEEDRHMESLTSWADPEILQQTTAPVESEYTGYVSISTMPNEKSRISDHLAIFGDAVQMEVATPLRRQVYAGDTIPLDFDFRVLQPVENEYKLFIHLYGSPSPYEGGSVWTQVDSLICTSYPMTLWQPFEIINQHFNLTLPADIPPGDYTIVTGLYNPEDNSRLPLTNAPEMNQWHHFELFQIGVLSPEE
jgi:hypothetical protein